MGVNLLEARRHLILEQPHLETASGAMVTFKRGIPADARNCVINISPTQPGSGTPSTSNVRPITGWTGCNIYVSPTMQSGDGEVYSVSWNTGAETVYGGTLDLAAGTLTLTHRGKTLNGTTDGVTYTVNYTQTMIRFYPSQPYIIIPESDTVVPNWLYCDKLPTVSNHDAYVNNIPGINISTSDQRVYINIDGQKRNLDAAKAWLAENPLQIVYQMQEPVVYQLDPVTIRTLGGVNNIWSNAGDIELSYWAH